MYRPPWAPVVAVQTSFSGWRRASATGGAPLGTGAAAGAGALWSGAVDPPAGGAGAGAAAPQAPRVPSAARLAAPCRRTRRLRRLGSRTLSEWSAILTSLRDHRLH